MVFHKKVYLFEQKGQPFLIKRSTLLLNTQFGIEVSYSFISVADI